MRKTAIVVSTVLVLGLAGQAQAAKPESVQAHELVELFEKLSGKHPGVRKAHASGVCATGSFTPNSEAGPFADAPLLSGGELPISVRFSMGGGNPNADERAAGTRGMAVQITLEDGSRHIFTGNNFPVFAGKDPETFYGFLMTLLPDENGQRNPAKTMQYIKENPSVQANAAWNQQAKTVYSYANTEFFGLHTFFYDSGDESVMFRWHISPELGVKTIEPEQAQTLETPFLAERLAKQVAEDSVSFALNVSVGEEGDAINDPSAQWPADRQVVNLGTITLESTGGDACTATNFDPNVLSQGFTPGDDPVLKMRSAAYAISFGKRLSGQ